MNCDFDVDVAVVVVLVALSVVERVRRFSVGVVWRAAAAGVVIRRHGGHRR